MSSQSKRPLRSARTSSRKPLLSLSDSQIADIPPRNIFLQTVSPTASAPPRTGRISTELSRCLYWQQNMDTRMLLTEGGLAAKMAGAADVTPQKLSPSFAKPQPCCILVPCTDSASLNSTASLVCLNAQR